MASADDFSSSEFLSEIRSIKGKVKRILKEEIDDDFEVGDVRRLAKKFESIAEDLKTYNVEAAALLDDVRGMLKDLMGKLKEILARRKIKVVIVKDITSEEETKMAYEIKRINNDVAQAILALEKAMAAATEAEKAAAEANLAAIRAQQAARAARDALREAAEAEERRKQQEEERLKREQEEKERRERERIEKERLKKEEEERKKREEEERLAREAEIKQREEEEERKRLELKKQKQDEERERKEKDERKRREEEKRRQEEERQRVEEERRREEEERKRREDDERKAQTLTDIEIDRRGGDFDGGLSCVIRGDPDRYSVTCRSLDPEQYADPVCEDGEQLVSNIIHLSTSDDDTLGVTTLERPILVAIPYNSQQVRGGTASEVVMKAETSPGVWQQVSAAHEITIDRYKNLRFFANEVGTLPTKLAVVTRRRRDSLKLPKKGGSAAVSNIDKNITLQLLHAAKHGKDIDIALQLLPIEADVKAKLQRFKGLHASSSLANIQWPPSGYNEKVSMTLSMPPIVVKNQKLARKGSVSQNTQSLNFTKNNIENTTSDGGKDESVLCLVRKNRSGQWITDDDIKVKQIRPDVVQFEFLTPLERFLILRLASVEVRSARGVDFAESIEQMICKHAVRSLLRQRADNPSDVIHQLVPSTRVEAVLRKFREQGYTEGPVASQEFLLGEGDSVVLTFKGNTKCADDGSVPLQSFRASFDRPQTFTMGVIDKFIQKHYSAYRGTVDVTWVKKTIKKGGIGRASDGSGNEVMTSHELEIPKENVSGLVIRRAPVKVSDGDLVRFVARHMKDEWIELAEPLKVANAAVHNILRRGEQGELNTEQMKHEMVLAWFKLQPKDSNKAEVLADLLRKHDKNIAARLDELRRREISVSD